MVLYSICKVQKESDDESRATPSPTNYLVVRRMNQDFLIP